MDSTSGSVTPSSNCSHSSPVDSVNNNTMQNGISSPSGDSEDAEEMENVDNSGGNRTSVSGRITVGSVGNVSVTSADPDSNANSAVTVQNDPDVDRELEELAKLRCPSVATEVVAARYKRRCSDYPGFAFGSSIFSSNTMMKFSIIKNELHNIMNVQLKRVSINIHAWLSWQRAGCGLLRQDSH
ncbi:putative Tropomyosin-like 4 [Homarus americanus]|uniref:Putative Tropomyosin-like 4 n=1 Tax=Homarus americanus TaxID=6706 RepID=A0A8J5JPM5_HOMAM|nr:putative Tropomyosin-like 4 [Homarus americanus]